MAAVLCTSIAIQVNRSEPQLIRPARPTPRETKRLSDIDDQQGLRFHFPVIMSYKNNPPTSKHEKDPVNVIREALSRALEYYYPLAGRLREGPNKKLLVDCNEEGVLFIEADANVTLQQLGHALQPPSPFLEEFLFNVPGSDGILGCPMFLFQVTRLTCGGFILALRVNHTICDGVGLAQFLNTVGEIAQGANSPSTPPVWQRELLDARDPPRITCTHREYEEMVETIAQPPHPNLIQRSFYFDPKEMSAIRKQLPTHIATCSRFELITALVWKCRTLSLGLNPETIVRFSCVVNARGKRNNLGLPLGYYGNAFAFPAVVSTTELLRRNPLGYAVELVKESKAKMDEEYMRSAADFNAVRGRPRLPMSSRTDFIAADNTRTGVGDVDFGWGRPTFAGIARSTDMISFYARDNNYEDEYGILVPICLPLSCMERFEEELKRMVMTLEHVENRYKK